MIDILFYESFFFMHHTEYETNTCILDIYLQWLHDCCLLLLRDGEFGGGSMFNCW